MIVCQCNFEYNRSKYCNAMLQVELLIAYLIIDIHNPVCVVISR